MLCEFEFTLIYNFIQFHNVSHLVTYPEVIHYVTVTSGTFPVLSTFWGGGGVGVLITKDLNLLVYQC